MSGKPLGEDASSKVGVGEAEAGPSPTSAVFEKHFQTANLIPLLVYLPVSLV